MDKLIVLLISGLLIGLPIVSTAKSPDNSKKVIQLAKKDYRTNRTTIYIDPKYPHRSYYIDRCRAIVNHRYRVGKLHRGYCRVYYRGVGINARYYQVLNRYGHWQWVTPYYYYDRHHRYPTSGFSIWFSSGR